VSSEYTSCDPTKLDDWLKEVGPDFSQYTYQLLLSGADRLFLPQMSEDLLKDDCGMVNGIHRARVLQKIRGIHTLWHRLTYCKCLSDGTI